MAEWTFSDGTVLHSGGAVEGDSVLAEGLRRDVEASKGRFPPKVAVAPLPDGYWQLDAEVDFTLNALAQETARRNQAIVTTAYAEGDDVPVEVLELRSFEPEPGRIY